MDAVIAARNAKDAVRRKSVAVALAHEDDDYDSDEEDVQETCKETVAQRYGVIDGLGGVSSDGAGAEAVDPLRAFVDEICDEAVHKATTEMAE